MKWCKITLQNIKKIFYVLMICILGFFLFMQFFGANEQKSEHYSIDSIIYPGTFVWEKEDGTYEEIAIPGVYDVLPGKTMVISTILPDDYTDTTIAIRSSLQDIQFYIDDELREEYTTQDSRLSGKNSASRYIFCNTSYLDAGKKLTIELTTHTANYSGVVNQIFCGNQVNIWQYIYNQYGASSYIAFFILFVGLTTVLFSAALKFVYHKNFDMEYFGWATVMGSMWMLGESKIRQILVPNASSLASLCFVMIMLCPLPLLFYADSIQDGLHRRLYIKTSIFVLFNFTVCSFLHIAGILDFIETLPIGQIILGLVFVMILIHLYNYLRKNHSRTDDLLLFGLFLVLVCFIIESISVYFITFITGVFIGLGMLFLLFINILRTVFNIQHIEANRQKEEIEKEQKRNEEMTLQMMRSLVMTIEAKNEYNYGHSTRVAEYSAIIADKLNWSKKEIEHLKICAYLHDIGNIGIPDNILHKPGVLTDEEYSIIQKHTILGEEILKNITEVPELSKIVRSHHEFYDGTGYPDGLSGNDILIQARIINLAGSFDAMNSKRIYRKALPIQEIIKELKKQSGKHFDPKLVTIFLECIHEGKISSIEAKDKKLIVDDEPINKFIFDVVTAFKDQEDNKSYDTLTGLPDRNLGELLIANEMQKSCGCLAFLDMDNLKKINDVYGHKAGDRALQKFGGLLKQYTNNGVACRLGGDEFLLYLRNVNSVKASTLMTELFNKFHEIIQNDAEISFATLSAGLYMCNTNDTFADCYSKADNALYYVKQSGKNYYSFYNQCNNQNDSMNNKVDLQRIAYTLKVSGFYNGSLDLEYREFSRQYDYILELVKREKLNCYLVMLTMESNVNPLPEIETIEKSLKIMGESIRHNLRKVDIYCRFSTMQYLVILVELDELDIPNIMNRIFMQYDKEIDNECFKPTYEYFLMKDVEYS